MTANARNKKSEISAIMRCDFFVQLGLGSLACFVVLHFNGLEQINRPNIDDDGEIKRRIS